MLTKSISTVTIVILLAVMAVACGGGATPTPTPTCTFQPVAESVAILVVDGFSLLKSDLATSDPAKFKELIDDSGSKGENCVVTPSGLAYGAGGVTGTDLKGRPHGDWVYEVLTSTLKNCVADKSVPRSSTCNDGAIHIVGVDIAGQNGRFTTTSVKEKIDKAVQALNLKDVKGIVINMSFAIMPCKPNPKLTPQEYNAKVDQYIKSVGAEGVGLKELEAFLKFLGDPASQKGDLPYQPAFGVIGLSEAYTGIGDYIAKLQNDPLLVWLNSHKTVNGVPVISVAAAGNDDLGFPYAPARWDSVLSVSAPKYGYDYIDKSGVKVHKTLKSNSGEVRVEGVHPADGTLWGTSFAAPRVSLDAALYLQRGGSVSCTGSRPGQPQLPLKYQPITKEWKNLDLKTAADEYCSCFLYKP